MADNKIQIVIQAVDNASAAINAAAAGLKGMGGAAANAAPGLSAARQGVKSISESLEQLKTAAIGAFAFTGLSGGLEGVVALADAMRALDNRLLLTAKNTADYAAAQKTVAEVAAASHQGLSEIGTLYNRMALATANLNVSQKDLADVTKTVALSVAISGSSAQESAAGMLQFAQAMGSGRLQGDELRSVMESMPMLAKLLVDAAGGSMAKMREMAEKGQLTTEWMIESIKKGQGQIEAMATAMPRTVGMAMTDLKNAFATYIAESDRSTGATAVLAGGITTLGKNLDTVANTGAVVLTGALSVLVGRGIMALVGSLPRAIDYLRLLGTTSVTTAAQLGATSTATTATSFSMATLGARLIRMPNWIGLITTALSMGYMAWQIWGKGGLDAVESVGKRLEAVQRQNTMMKEISDPTLKLAGIQKEIEAAEAAVARLSRPRQTRLGIDVRGGASSYQAGSDASLAAARKNLAELQALHQATNENITISNQQRGAKLIAGSMAIGDFERDMAKQREELIASGLAKELLGIEKKRALEIKDAQARFKDAGDLVRAKAAINSAYDADANAARTAAGKKFAADRLALEKKVDGELRQLKGDDRQFQIEAIGAEYQERVKAAGNNQALVAKETEWKTLSIEKIKNTKTQAEKEAEKALEDRYQKELQLDKEAHAALALSLDDEAREVAAIRDKHVAARQAIRAAILEGVTAAGEGHQAIQALEEAETREIEENAAKRGQADTKGAADRAAAYRAMYGDMTDVDGQYYNHRRLMLAKQADEYSKATGDQATAKRWLVQQWALLDREYLAKHGGFIGGMVAQWQKLQEQQTTTAQLGGKVFLQAVGDMRKGFSDLFYDAMVGDLKDLDSYFNSLWKNILRSFADFLAEWAAMWAANEVVKWISGDKASISGNWGLSLSPGTVPNSPKYGVGNAASAASSASTLYTGWEVASAGGTAGETLATMYPTLAKILGQEQLVIQGTAKAVAAAEASKLAAVQAAQYEAAMATGTSSGGAAAGGAEAAAVAGEGWAAAVAPWMGFAGLALVGGLALNQRWGSGRPAKSNPTMSLDYWRSDPEAALATNATLNETGTPGRALDEQRAAIMQEAINRAIAKGLDPSTLDFSPATKAFQFYGRDLAVGTEAAILDAANWAPAVLKTYSNTLNQIVDGSFNGMVDHLQVVREKTITSWGNEETWAKLGLGVGQFAAGADDAIGSVRAYKDEVFGLIEYQKTSATEWTLVGDALRQVLPEAVAWRDQLAAWPAPIRNALEQLQAGTAGVTGGLDYFTASLIQQLQAAGATREQIDALTGTFAAISLQGEQTGAINSQLAVTMYDAAQAILTGTAANDALRRSHEQLMPYMPVAADGLTALSGAFGQLDSSVGEIVRNIWSLAGQAEEGVAAIATMYDQTQAGAPGHAAGLAVVPYNDYFARLHQGEMVMDADTTSRLRRYGIQAAAGGNGVLTAELKELRRDLARANYAIAKNTKHTADLLRRWEGAGQPPVRVAA